MAHAGGRPSKYSPAYCTIYSLSDPETGEIRYIGKANDPKKRLESHVWPGKSAKTPVAQWCKSLRARGLRPIMRALEEVEDWEAAEKRWIAQYRSGGARLLNLSAGGLDMDRVKEARGRYPAYVRAIQFCGKVGNTDLAASLRARADEAKEAGRMAEFEDVLQQAIGHLINNQGLSAHEPRRET